MAAGPDQRHSLFTPNSVASMADIISPSRMKLPSRKRSHSNHLDGALAPFEGYKSRRTSPSPYLTGHSTSSTTTSEYGSLALPKNQLIAIMISPCLFTVLHSLIFH
jgi:hypothetical protein